MIKDFDMDTNEHYESIATTISKKNEYNAACMGLEINKSNIILFPYIDTKTFENIEDTHVIVINVIYDAQIYVACTLREDTSKYIYFDTELKMPVIKDSCAYIKATLDHYEVKEKKDDISKSKYAKMFFNLIDYKTTNKKPRFYSRSNSALIEACIIASKKRKNPNLQYLREIISKTSPKDLVTFDKITKEAIA